MKSPKGMVMYAEVLLDGQTYIYSPGGKPTNRPTGEPYSNFPNDSICMPLYAAHLYPLIDEDGVETESGKSIVKP